MELVDIVGPRRHFLVILVVLTLTSVSDAVTCWTELALGSSIVRGTAFSDSYGTAATTLDECRNECLRRSTCGGIDWQPKVGVIHCTLGTDPTDPLNVVPADNGVIHYRLDKTICPTVIETTTTAGKTTTTKRVLSDTTTSRPLTTASTLTGDTTSAIATTTAAPITSPEDSSGSISEPSSNVTNSGSGSVITTTSTPTTAMPATTESSVEEWRPLTIILLAMLGPLVLGVTCCCIWMFFGGREPRRIVPETSTTAAERWRPPLPAYRFNGPPGFSPYGVYGPGGRPMFASAGL